MYCPCKCPCKPEDKNKEKCHVDTCNFKVENLRNLTLSSLETLETVITCLKIECKNKKVENNLGRYGKFCFKLGVKKPVRPVRVS